MLNGWQRLWILVCVLWGALVVSIFYVLLYTEGELGLTDNVSWSDTALRVLLVLVMWAVALPGNLCARCWTGTLASRQLGPIMTREQPQPGMAVYFLTV